MPKLSFYTFALQVNVVPENEGILSLVPQLLSQIKQKCLYHGKLVM